MLQIHNVRLENFCQHDALSLGITVILGPNGSGKSNLTHGIYAALTGSFNRGMGRATSRWPARSMTGRSVSGAKSDGAGTGPEK